MNEFTKERIEETRKYFKKHKTSIASNQLTLEMLDEIQRLQSRVQELEAERRWISVSERPKQHGWHFVLYNDKINWDRGFVGVNFYHIDKKEWSNEENIEFYCEFQPELPQPPKDGE